MDLESNSYRNVAGESDASLDQERGSPPAKRTWFTTRIPEASPNGNPSQPTPKWVSLLRWINDHWVLEIASCIGGLAALFCIIGVLVKYDGTAIPDWPYGITLNSVLSWIVLVFNAFMLGTMAACFGQMAWINFSVSTDRPLSDVSSYHWASRGAIGCVAFLWGSKMRNWASLGAFATILAVAVSPFVQQMATVQNNRVAVDWPASVGRAQTYLGYTPGYMPEDGMIAAIYSFILGGDSSTASRPSIPVMCDSGDCDFSPFRSLAVCSTCSDISNLLTSNCETRPSFSTNVTTCNYSLPDGMYGNASEYTESYGPYIQTNVSFVPEELPHSTNWPSDRSMILNLTEIRVANVSEFNASATQCSLYWCVNTYSAHVRNHKLVENVTESWHDPNPVLSFTVAPDGLRLDFQPPTKENLIQSNFTLDATASGTIQDWLLNKLIIDTTTDAVCPDGRSCGVTMPLPPLTEFLNPLLHSSLNNTFQTLATAMTTRVRQLDPATQTTTSDDEFGPLDAVEFAKGTSFAVLTQIKVKWAWIIVPSLLLISTTVFLGITIFKTRQNGLKAWKCSPLPLACSGLNENTQQQVRAAGDPTLMEVVAGDIQVHLQKDVTNGTDGCWTLEVTRALAKS